jgi:hypothetical protein
MNASRRILAGLALTLGAGAAWLALAAPAPAAVTIGSNLTTPATDNSPGCNLACTTANLALPAANQAPDGLVSPVTGTVTSWRIASGSSGNPVSLRVLRPAGTLTFTGVGTSAPGTTVGGIAGPFPTSLPINAGDSIGVDSPNAALILGMNGAATSIYWTIPPLAEGAARLGTASPGREVMVQATVEPSNQLAIQRVRKNKRKGLAKLVVIAPNAGGLKLGGKLIKLKGPKRVGAGQRFVVNVKAKGKKAKKLKRNGKVGVKPKLTYIPDAGTSATRPVKLKLKQKKSS